MTIAEPPVARARVPDHGLVLLENMTWDNYESLLEIVGERPAIRITFDRGRLEIMTVSSLHELVKTIVARLVETYSLEADLPIVGFGSMTHKRKDLARGLEPDECYYVASAERIRGKADIDLKIDPPPDLALEIDISPHALDRQSIYAALGVPELWRFDGVHIVVLLRNAAGAYERADRSRAFPNLPMDVLNRFVQMARTASQHEAAKAMQKWVREQTSGPR